MQASVLNDDAPEVKIEAVPVAVAVAVGEFSSNTIHLKLVDVAKLNKEHETERTECDICYKVIWKEAFVCSSPCNKKFHINCLDTVFQNDNDNSRMYDVPEIFRCCYCRREVDIARFFLEIFVKDLNKLHKQGYNVTKALSITNSMIDGTIEPEPLEHEIYLQKNISYFKTPKKSKKSQFKQRYIKKGSNVNRRVGIIRRT